MVENAPQLREGSDQGGDEDNGGDEDHGGEEVGGVDEGQGGGEARDGEDQSGHGINTFLFKTKLFYSYEI